MTVLVNVKPNFVALAMVKEAVTAMANARAKVLVGDRPSAQAYRSSCNVAIVRIVDSCRMPD